MPMSANNAQNIALFSRKISLKTPILSLVTMLYYTKLTSRMTASAHAAMAGNAIGLLAASDDTKTVAAVTAGDFHHNERRLFD
jgi:hypothetical protein